MKENASLGEAPGEADQELNLVRKKALRHDDIREGRTCPSNRMKGTFRKGTKNESLGGPIVT